MKQELLTMLAMQEEMNARVHPQWRKQGYEWYRAIWIESAELMDHYGWKWWKKQSPDRAQVELELIDIWHFGLSALLQGDQSEEVIADDIISQFLIENATQDFKLELEAFTQVILGTRNFDVLGFARLLRAIDMPFERLFQGYVGKNVLNFFRQDHGYKDGSYLKIWNDKEDNEHLVEVLAELDSSDEQFRERLYTELKRRYPN